MIDNWRVFNYFEDIEFNILKNIKLSVEDFDRIYNEVFYGNDL